MLNNLTFERIKDTMVNCQQMPAHLITPESTIEGLGGDSLDEVELAILLEEEFGIEIPVDTFDTGTPISEIAKSIEGIINK
jgi:acyl carrier protein